MFPLVFDGRQIAQGRVATGRVVEAFDELKDGHPRLAVRSEATPIDRLCGCFPIKRLSGPRVEGGGHGCNLVGAVHAEIGPFGEVLAQQSVSVLVGAPLPWAVRIAETVPSTDIISALAARYLRHDLGPEDALSWGRKLRRLRPKGASDSHVDTHGQ
jgi:hypothetical protein